MSSPPPFLSKNVIFTELIVWDLNKYVSKIRVVRLTQNVAYLRFKS